MTTWILTKEKTPEHGQLIVKYWAKTGEVWAGRHVASPKYESFDKWCLLPEPEEK